MNLPNYLSIRLFLLFSLVLFLTSCTAGDAQFTEQSQAGFFYGLWHGVISVISLIFIYLMKAFWCMKAIILVGGMIAGF